MPITFQSKVLPTILFLEKILDYKYKTQENTVLKNVEKLFLMEWKEICIIDYFIYLPTSISLDFQFRIKNCN